jgi:hypothetical protein
MLKGRQSGGNPNTGSSGMTYGQPEASNVRTSQQNKEMIEGGEGTIPTIIRPVVNPSPSVGGASGAGLSFSEKYKLA